jgi:hypothetical protein
MANSPAVLQTVDWLNIWGLIAIGMALFFGAFTRLAAGLGIALLTLYYIANPPFIGMDYGMPAEGHYLIVNKNLIEMMGLALLMAIPKVWIPGIDRLWTYISNYWKKQRQANPYKMGVIQGIERREVIKNLAALPIFGGFVIGAIKKKGWLSYEEKFLKDPDAITGATLKQFDYSDLKDLREPVPTSTAIGGLNISRMILGGNLIGGWAHARDLIYVSKLVKSYHTDDKVFETFRLAEACGINTILTNPLLCRVINKYWHHGLGNIQFISDCGSDNILEGVQRSIDHGAAACYVHGGYADQFVSAGKIDQIAAALDLIRQNGLPAGIGAHRLATVQACVDYGLVPDFWMKTLHVKDYLQVAHELEPGRVSHHEEVMYQNVFCENTDGTVAYMAGLDQPWIAFKILAAGAIRPETGFRYAFDHGADFICVGMYDFQVVENANLVVDILQDGVAGDRPRPWLG